MTSHANVIPFPTRTRISGSSTLDEVEVEARRVLKCVVDPLRERDAPDDEIDQHFAEVQSLMRRIDTTAPKTIDDVKTKFRSLLHPRLGIDTGYFDGDEAHLTSIRQLSAFFETWPTEEQQ